MGLKYEVASQDKFYRNPGNIFADKFFKNIDIYIIFAIYFKNYVRF